ncbi:hypothetical protein TCA2_1907 [Paenibacillus sp. TCA20]|uniref:hypothetical protein n=1 Tax=Paenibacillus sp. TCA20 TaxID=1499968 RepID=UPI0004D481BE|nr:hypothetical protein [Paenibacillus sp. TCA20]GAK39419.1 hypothetical protein TCA2_1907 [Paenibacillus sp. TCA20]
MSKEKSNDWLEEPFDEVYEREFEEAFDLAFENAAAASTSVNKEAMAASWDKVNHEIQNIKKRKKTNQTLAACRCYRRFNYDGCNHIQLSNRNSGKYVCSETAAGWR